MEKWEEDLKEKISEILVQYSKPTEAADGKYKSAVFINSFESISEEITRHLIYEYGFSKIDPDVVSELELLKKDLELKRCETCKHLMSLNNYCKNLERFVNVQFSCAEHCL